MSTNTYQALCDSVGAYEITYTYDIKGINWFGGIFTQTFTKKEFRKDAWRWLTKEYRSDRKVVKVNKKITYPPATAEQSERLEELILKAGYDLFMNNTQIGWQYFYTNRGFETDYMCHKDKPQLVYALTHKLIQEGVLSKEEVAKALKGGSDETIY